MRCSSRSCECNKCSDCGEQHCICELLDDTNRLLRKNDYTYEDFAHTARYLLERWVSAR